MPRLRSELPVDAFGSHARKPGGRDTYCRAYKADRQRRLPRHGARRRARPRGGAALPLPPLLRGLPGFVRRVLDGGTIEHVEPGQATDIARVASWGAAWRGHFRVLCGASTPK